MIALNCFAFQRYYDPIGPWECYVLAENPIDSDITYCIIFGDNIECNYMRRSEIAKMFNALGQAPVLDKNFRPKLATEILKQLEMKNVTG